MKDFIIDPLKSIEQYNRLLNDMKERKVPISTYGISEEALGHFSYALSVHSKRQTLIITHNEINGQKMVEELTNVSQKPVEHFPTKDLQFYDLDALSSERETQRLNVLSRLNRGEDIIVVASIDGIINRILSPDDFSSMVQTIEYGKNIDLDDVISKFIQGGYERVPMVEGRGQFSLRGGILDFFPPDSQNPYRVELFDTEVDSIRIFEIGSQRSLDNIDMVDIPPAQEILIKDDHRQGIIDGISKDLKKAKKHIDKYEKFHKYMDLLEEKGRISNLDILIPYIPKAHLANLIDYFHEDSLIVLDEPRRIEERYKNISEDFNVKLTDLLEAFEALASHKNMTYEYKDLIPSINKRLALLNTALIKGDSYFKPKSINNFLTKSVPSYQSKMELLKDDIEHYQYKGYKIIIFAGNEERGYRILKTLNDFDIDAQYLDNRDLEIKSSQIYVLPNSIKDGFEYPSIKLLAISDKDIFGAGKNKSPKKRKRKKSSTINLSDLNIGDYVVHENYGIGKYEGVEKLDIQGINKDYIKIQYRGLDKLYLPIDQMSMIQKYIGSDSGKPKINKLSGSEWSKTKAKARKAVEDMAEDLLDLYAKREKLKGYSFSEDTPWQKEFEDLFPYEETDGQLQAIEEIKADMEKPRPMDRLLCGDVGYGKTEVALRAAFKAIMEGKQVAFLVPTTILAQQHYNTIVDRFSNFPVNINMLSRFRSPKQQKEIIDGVNKGMVDIVVGTHKLLSKDIKFKDLGLLIIDEEQRFGVKHKEKLKMLKESVDVLTLTATPIPRTLHMSLVGIRDMSVIEDPPEERYPIQTYVMEYNEQMIRDAILKEMARGGQVYLVYNRVETIDRFAHRMQQLVPKARFSVGHGQMAERQLENVMVDFIEGESDCLVCTTIIETGLDIPNVNTMIIYNADKMGLSQLYQLRGRVGRTNRIAYGYFTYEKGKVLTEVAEKRLRALKEFTDFGSGFKIAMRDLEIRGSGNLLGVEQHGNIESVGYDLYVKFLNEALRKLKGEVIKDKADTTVELKIDGFIPESYIQNEDQKIEIYKKISVISQEKEYDELIDELIDRFGDLPQAVINLMDVSYIRSMASENNIQNIIGGDTNISIEFVDNFNIELDFIQMLSETYGKNISFDLSKNPKFKLTRQKDIINNLKHLMKNMKNFKKTL